MATCIEALKQWTGTSTATTLYDSDVECFSNRAVMDALQGRPNIALVAISTDGDVFGGFHSRPVRRRSPHANDPDIFLFSFRAYGSRDAPQRFVASREKRDRALVRYNPCQGPSWFVAFVLNADRAHPWICDGMLTLCPTLSDFCRWSLSTAVESMRMRALAGSSGKCHDHLCVRLVVLQLV